MAQLQGIKSSKEGFKVQTLAPNEWNLNTPYPNLKVQSVNYLTTDGLGTPLTITHNLGYKPVTMVWMPEVLTGRYIFSGDVVQGAPTLNIGINDITVNSDVSNPTNLIVYVFYDPLTTTGAVSTPTPPASYGAIVSQPGFDVFSAEEKDKVFDSRWNTLKYHRNFSDKLTYTSSTTNTINHNFGYVPAFFAFIKQSGDTFWRYMYYNFGIWEATANDTNIMLLAQNGDVVRYFIYFNPVEQNPDPVTADTGSHGMRITNVGEDVTDTDINTRNFDSGLAVPMIYNTVNLTVNQTGGGAYPQLSAKVAHGLTYAPAFYATFTGTSIGGTINVPYLVADFFDGLIVEVYVDANDVWASVTAPPFGSYDISATWDFKVRILNDSLD